MSDIEIYRRVFFEGHPPLDMPPDKKMAGKEKRLALFIMLLYDIGMNDVANRMQAFASDIEPSEATRQGKAIKPKDTVKKTDTIWALNGFVIPMGIDKAAGFFLNQMTWHERQKGWLMLISKRKASLAAWKDGTKLFEEFSGRFYHRFGASSELFRPPSLPPKERHRFVSQGQTFFAG